MKAIIIEDETAAVTSLKAILAQNKVVPIEVVAELESIEESVCYFKNNPHPDIIFMDIHLADGTAFKIFEQVEIDAPVVFTTAYDDYALQAFQVSSVDYLLKPVTLISLERSLNKLRLFNTEQRLEHIRKTNKTITSRHTIKSLLIMLPDKFYPLPVEQICYIYTTNEKVTAYTMDGKQHPVDSTLDALSEQLDENIFFRANRQFIISRQAIKDIELWFGSRLSVNLIIPIPERIIISKNKSPILKKWILSEE
ncbi:LytTR family DNA-binding domain-containing protein [Parabacteroides sp. PF5-9]|uniref:LytR/AlgR family response regulator transcription factor n=1 Tax=Parabacteroides sp. PF5-9 TaxID=1742404 RepID=UPI0024751E32|nr:LytTR family DNA-binding domain-containing protein [Parabacteroides sp. PF5-9]MDH6358863.1 two-component system response regulator LytT [Parabacteroides sp. PF5-9]